MNPLSQTRSARTLTHLLQTPDTFVRTAMPSIQNGTATVHAAPVLGAGFIQYTVELAAGGSLAPASQQRFLYMLAGTATLTIWQDPFTGIELSSHELRRGSYAYLPPRHQPVLVAQTAARMAVIEKRYVERPQTWDSSYEMPAALIGHEEGVEPTPLNGDPNLLVRALLPDHFDFDFAVNTMTYAPGAALAQVEIHVMEHGLLMLEGEGPYRLGDTFYDARAGDFIWMAPFCPQWFQASANGPAKYLIYKDANRMPAL